MELCYFVSDLHGDYVRFEKLFRSVKSEKPSVLFIGGDIFPHAMSLKGRAGVVEDFLSGFFIENLRDLKKSLGNLYPEIFLILGNDDGKFRENDMLEYSEKGFFHYCHLEKKSFKGFDIYGYSYIPPSPFRLKDWEKYDVSQFVDPGCTGPEDGWHSQEVNKDELKYSTIAGDLNSYAKEIDLSKSIFLFHSPPYDTNLDRAALDGAMIDHAPVDPHIGSIAIRKFIESKQPYLTLHGHCHESSRLTGKWKDKIGNTLCLSAALERPELAIIKFDIYNPGNCIREIL
jgi:Icc-related predicted phosphoesterase